MRLKYGNLPNNPHLAIGIRSDKHAKTCSGSDDGSPCRTKCTCCFHDAKREDLYSLPVYLHLDHRRNLDQIRRAVELGFYSVMYDGSALPWAEVFVSQRKYPS